MKLVIVDGPSYRLAEESLKRIFGSRQVTIHEGIRQTGSM